MVAAVGIGRVDDDERSAGRPVLLVVRGTRVLSSKPPIHGGHTARHGASYLLDLFLLQSGRWLACALW